ncbi:hypothetical protein MAM1_0267d08952 [Mucor ambiguus]|uniref:Uncharacterized protein n=1 Tax=Mucor ambiguus TaxID=91626 RepID=A0A0C9LX03_9FUNG|nr:hypothetical protein MAM1_0267d08952 [Mucor ambiguus]
MRRVALIFVWNVKTSKSRLKNTYGTPSGNVLATLYVYLLTFGFIGVKLGNQLPLIIVRDTDDRSAYSNYLVSPTLSGRFTDKFEAICIKK